MLYKFTVCCSAQISGLFSLTGKEEAGIVLSPNRAHNGIFFLDPKLIFISRVR